MPLHKILASKPASQGVLTVREETIFFYPDKFYNWDV